jgi:hypothetical protein
MYSFFFFTLYPLLLSTLFLSHPSSPSPRLLSARKIWSQAEHNAFTDLIYHRQSFLCTFREADSHVGGENGKIRILSSSDTHQWSSLTEISQEGVDLRDPTFEEMPDGRLMLLMGGAVYDQEGKFMTRYPCVTFSSDGGRSWEPLQILNDLEGEWLWSVTWDRGFGYSPSYSMSDKEDWEQPWLLKLFQTADGTHYHLIHTFDLSSFPSEATLRFLPDGTMVALVRRYGNGLIGSAVSPYTEWQWVEVPHQLGGPNFLILPNGEMWACSRRVELKSPDSKERLFYTTVARMSLKDYEPVLDLPSGGDTSYPGMVYKEGKLYISYYSSHEGKSAIYLATLALSSD